MHNHTRAREHTHAWQIHFVPVNDGTGERVMEYGRLAGEELEIIRLLRLSIPLLTSPGSMADFIKGCKETFWLLLLLVKIEGTDVGAGLSKAWVEFNAAALEEQKTDVSRRRANLMVAVMSLAFTAARKTLSLFRRVYVFIFQLRTREEEERRRQMIWKQRRRTPENKRTIASA